MSWKSWFQQCLDSRARYFTREIWQYSLPIIQDPWYRHPRVQNVPQRSDCNLLRSSYFPLHHSSNGASNPTDPIWEALVYGSAPNPLLPPITFGWRGRRDSPEPACLGLGLSTWKTALPTANRFQTSRWPDRNTATTHHHTLSQATHAHHAPPCWPGLVPTLLKSARRSQICSSFALGSSTPRRAKNNSRGAP